MRDKTNSVRFISLIPHPSSFNYWFHIRLHLKSIRQLVGLVEKCDDCHKLPKRLIVQPQPLHGGGVGVDSVVATVRDADGERNHLFRQRVQFARRHHALEFRPDLLQQRRATC